LQRRHVLLSGTAIAPTSGADLKHLRHRWQHIGADDIAAATSMQSIAAVSAPRRGGLTPRRRGSHSSRARPALAAPRRGTRQRPPRSAPAPRRRRASAIAARRRRRSVAAAPEAARLVGGVDTRALLLGHDLRLPLPADHHAGCAGSSTAPDSAPGIAPVPALRLRGHARRRARCGVQLRPGGRRGWRGCLRSPAGLSHR